MKGKVLGVEDWMLLVALVMSGLTSGGFAERTLSFFFCMSFFMTLEKRRQNGCERKDGKEGVSLRLGNGYKGDKTAC